MNDLTVAEPIAVDTIRSRILTIRGVQVMLDRDLAELYGVPTKALNQAVKRNIERFPAEFMFALHDKEMNELVTNCDRFKNMKHSSVPMRAFTEYGIIMLASVLKSDVATMASIRITRAFVAMRKTLATFAPLLARIEATERRQLKQEDAQRRNEERFDTIFKAMDGGDFSPQKVFYEGRHYEAYSFAKKLVRRAIKSIALVDGYCDDVTLDILLHKRGGVSVTIATVAKTPITATAIAKFNKQNPTLTINTTGVFHDRFLIIDGAELYHFGASLKNLGRQYCAVSKMDAAFIPSIMERIRIPQN